METNTVSQFDLEAPRLWALQKGIFIRTLVFFIFFTIIMVFSDASTFTINGVKQPLAAARWSTAICMLVVLILTLIIQQRRLKGKYKGYTIRLNNNMLESSNARNDRMLLQFAEVRKVMVHAGGSFAIYSVNKPVLFIPLQVNNRDELETLLNERVPGLIKAPDTFYYRHYASLFFSVLELLFAAFVFKNKIWVSAISLPLLLLLTYDLTIRIKTHKTRMTKFSEKGDILIVIGLILFVVENLVYKIFIA